MVRYRDIAGHPYLSNPLPMGVRVELLDQGLRLFSWRQFGLFRLLRVLWGSLLRLYFWLLARRG